MENQPQSTDATMEVPTPTGIDTLPQELWNKIVNACDPKDWKALRLACKHFEARATELAFREITVCIQPRSMKRLVGVAESERLGKHVLKLAVGHELLDRRPHWTPQVFLRHVQDRFLSQEPSGVGTAAPSDGSSYISFEDYQKVTKEDFSSVITGPWAVGINQDQDSVFELYKKLGDLSFENRELIDGNKCIEDLAKALSKLENLTTIHFQDNRCPRQKKSWGYETEPSPFLVPKPFDDILITHPRKTLFFAAAAVARTLKISELYIETNLDDHPDDTIVGFAADHIALTLPSLQCITKLELTVGHNHQLAFLGIIDNDLHVLSGILSGLPRLQHLKLSNPLGHYHASQVMSSIKSQYLVSISVESCLFDGENLLVFLKKHKKTLREFRMNRSLLVNGSFKSVFDYMRNDMQIERFPLKSFVVELETESAEYYPMFLHDTLQQHLARAMICDYVTRKPVDYDGTLLDEDPAVVTFEECMCPGVIRLIGPPELPAPFEDDSDDGNNEGPNNDLDSDDVHSEVDYEGMAQDALENGIHSGGEDDYGDGYDEDYDEDF